MVVAIDVRKERLDLISRHGATLTLDARELDAKELRRRLRSLASDRQIPTWRQRIFETSGTAAGQALAFGLLAHGGWLSVVGFTKESVAVRLSNLMALDATAQGNWGCLPEHYPAVVAMALSGRVALRPFVEARPLSRINECFAELREGRAARRLILRPS